MSSTVAVVRAGGDLVAAVAEALSGCGMADCVRRGDRVLIKPNLHGGDGYTSPTVAAAVVRWARAHGAREVIVADGAFWGQSVEQSREYFRRAGMTAACAAAGAELVDLHTRPYRLHHLDSPLAPPILGVSRLLYDCDVVINLPLMKTHFNTLVTISLKNVKGCLRRVDKRRLHERELNLALGVVNELIQPRVTVTLCDATTAYEGLGPGNGTPVPLGLLLASSDPVAVDAVACALMEIDPCKVRLIAECEKRGLGCGQFEAIEVVGERVEDHRRRFVLPHEALAQAFPGFTIHGAGACSCCTQNLFVAMKQFHDEGREFGCRSVLIGPGPETEADLLVGKCAATGRQVCPDVRGCPPCVGAIVTALARREG